MKQWIKQIQFVKQIASNLLLPRKSNYQDDYLLYKLTKNGHLKHVNFKTSNEFNEVLNATLIKHKQLTNDTCVLFLHGYGSNKQEGFTLIDFLPKEVDLCCFDFSGSGKSQGTITTYGLKEFRDISTLFFISGAIINKLKNQDFGYKRFILWGRSMGAVASFLITSSVQTCDMTVRKDIIYQVLDSPFSSFQSICAYQGRQSFNLPQPFISYGIKILQSYFKNSQDHLNPFNIDLVKISCLCQTNTLFVYSEHDDMIPKENSLSIIQKLSSAISYEKLLINQNHNTLRTQQTNQQIFKIVTKNYFKHLYNLHKNESFKIKNETNSLIASEKVLNKIESQINFSQKNLISKPYLQTNHTIDTRDFQSRNEPIKKEKKYLELFSTKQKSKKKVAKFKPQMKQIKIQIGQIHSYRNFSAKNIKNVQNLKKNENELIQSEDLYDEKNQINSINSFKDIHKLKRSNTFDCPEGYEQVQRPFNALSLEKAKNFQSSISTAMKTNDLEESLQPNHKMKKRALYCSLNKNFIPYKIGLKPSCNKNNPVFLVQESNGKELQ